MPRHTHPPLRAKHSRAHVRAERRRLVARRWRRAKALFASAFELACRPDGAAGPPPGFLHPEEIRRTPRPLRPPAWPFSDVERFGRNPFTLCSCPLCSTGPWRRADKRRERRRWRAEAAAELAEP